MADHVVRLPGTSWDVWRWVLLRGAGFPSHLVLRLAARDAAALIDRILDAEQEEVGARAAALDALSELTNDEADRSSPLRKAIKGLRRGRVPAPVGDEAADRYLSAIVDARSRLEQLRAELSAVLATDGEKISRAVADVAVSAPFREAVAWQNRNVLRTALDHFRRRESDPTAEATRGRKKRETEAIVAMYLQRYATKNDSIGFFGPFGWARLDESHDALAVTTRSNLVTSRRVSFEQWAVDALATAIERQLAITPWIAPRRFPFVVVDGTSVQSPVTGRITLEPHQVAVLARCDGARTARDLGKEFASEFPAQYADEAAFIEVLRELRDKKLIAFSLEIPLQWQPEKVLRRLLGRIDDEAIRTRALALVEALERARDGVAAAAGDADALDAAFGELERSFTELTGAEPSRHAGVMYAARGLATEDARRDVDVTLGPELFARSAPALDLVLSSARWFTYEVARAYRAAFHKVFDEVAARSGKRSVPLADFWFRAQRLVHGAKGKPVDAVSDELATRWASVLRLSLDEHRAALTASELQSRFGDTFAAPGPGFRLARFQCPDVMFAANGLEAIRRGEYLLVLGELHVAMNSLDSWAPVSTHPHAEDLHAAHASDLPEPSVRWARSKEFTKVTVRTTPCLTKPTEFFVESGFDPAPAPRDRALAIVDFIIEKTAAGELEVRTHDGRFRTDVIEFFGEALGAVAYSEFQIMKTHAHAPRVTIDNVVIARESWRFPSAELTFAAATTDADLFVAARRWARQHNFPRFIYAKSPLEGKPIYVDLESPLYISLFARIVRRMQQQTQETRPIVVSEMLPGLHELWLPGANGELYTSEMRFVAVDRAPGGANA